MRGLQGADPSVGFEKVQGEKRGSLLLHALFILLYVLLFGVYCALDTAPLPWDEAYLMYLPTAIGRAFEQEGVLEALKTFWTTRFMKPPLSMLGTLPGVLAFGTDSLGIRVDNVLVALLGAFFAYRFLGAYLRPGLAASFSLIILVSPYVLCFSRKELAEVYLWTVLLGLLCLLREGDGFRSRRWAGLVGCVFALGMMAKLSFPLLAAGPGSVTLWYAIRSGGREGDRSLRFRNMLFGGLMAVLVAAPFMAHNWKWMWRHLRAQYGWVGGEYRSGHPWSLDFAREYFGSFSTWIGGLWVGLALLALAAGVLSRAGPRKGGKESGALRFPSLLLGSCILVNLSYCYFVHPVPSQRFELGSMVALELLVSLHLGRWLDRVFGSRPWLPSVLLVPAFALLLNNSFLPGEDRPIWDSGLPGIGWARGAVEAPSTTPDLRDEILDRLPLTGREARIGLAGDHEGLNVDNLRLRVVESGKKAEVVQIGYRDPRVPLLHRLREADADLWVVILPSADGRGSAFPSRWAEPAREILDGMKDRYVLSSWMGDLGDGNRIVLYLRK